MPTKRVFLIRPVSSEDRPFIDFDCPENSERIEWLKVGEIVRGSRNISEYEAIHLTVPGPDATDWDFYSCAGTLGIFSARAKNLLGPDMSRCFHLLPVFLNNAEFFLLGVKDSLDCLDPEKSRVIPFQSDPTTVKEIERFVFRKDMIPDPILFVIPQGLFGVFGSDTIATLIHQSNLRGFEVTDAEQLDVAKP